MEYILGARMRRQKEVREDVLGRAGRCKEVAKNLQVKDVRVNGCRYIVCYNPEEASKDAADREAIIKSLEDKLKESPCSLVGNQGYRRFLRVQKGSVILDPKKIAADSRYDGKFVLRTNSDLAADEIAVQYKRLLMVEQFFRATKPVPSTNSGQALREVEGSTLDTRPVFHQWDATIKGHVFCSFLALVMMHELKRRLKKRGWELEWNDIRRDLQSLAEVEVMQGTQTYHLRTPVQGVAGKVLQAAGAAIPPSVKFMA